MHRKLNIIVACEFSGMVRDSFLDLGHNAISCDLLPCESVKYTNPQLHYQGNVLDILTEHPLTHQPYDLMIAHPPCTFMTNAGVRWLYIKDEQGNTIRNESRWSNLNKAATFFLQLYNAPIPHICIENPIMHKHAKQLIGVEQSQIIQPWMFNHLENKATCLWLRNLPFLKETNNVKHLMKGLPKSQTDKCHYMAPSADRSKLRSITYQGIAHAIATQYSNYVLEHTI